MFRVKNGYDYCHVSRGTTFTHCRTRFSKSFQTFAEKFSRVGVSRYNLVGNRIAVPYVFNPECAHVAAERVERRRRRKRAALVIHTCIVRAMARKS